MKKKFKDLTPEQQANVISLKRQMKKLAKFQQLRLDAKERRNNPTPTK